MIYELPPALYGAAAPLFRGARFDAGLVESAFEGRQESRLFVDDARRPAAGLLCRTYDYYLAGEPTAALRRFIRDAPEEAGVFQSLYGYVPLAESWVAPLLADHAGILERIPRRGFTFDPAGRPAIEARLRALPAGVAVAALDAALAERIDRELHEHIGLLWGGYDRFVAGGFGFCSLIAGTPASVAFASAVSDRHANISVSTAAPFRRRGLAALTCAAFVAHCLQRDLIPTWESDAANAASIATARSLGFGAETPFSELGTPGRRALACSRGRWAARAWTEEPAVTEWRPL